MDFRIYVYKINKLINKLIVKKIFNLFFLAALVTTLLLTKPFCVEWLSLQPLFLKDFVLFDFANQNNMIYSIVWISVAALWLILWLSCISNTSSIKKNIKLGSSGRMRGTKGLKFSNLLDLIALGWIIPIAKKKKIIISVYNFGVDEWLDYNGY